MAEENMVRTPVRVGKGNSSHRTNYEEFETVVHGKTVSLNVDQVSTKHEVHNYCTALSVDMAPAVVLELAELLIRAAREAMSNDDNEQVKP